MKRFITVILCIIVVVTGITAYKIGSSQTKKIVAAGEPAQAHNGSANSGDSSQQKVLSDKQEVPKSETSAAGIYVGQIDNNSIEVKVNNEEKAFFFSEEVKNSFKASLFRPGSQVQITYYKSDTAQLILTGIKPVAATNPPKAPSITTVEGDYEGQMDNNSIEVIIAGKPTALYFSDQVKKSFNPRSYSKGMKVRMTYYKNDKGQLILTAFKSLSTTNPVQGTTSTGYYSGQMDSNSIEVTINGKATAFFLSDAVKSSFNTKNFKTGSKVQVTYYKNDKGQLILTSIKGV